MNLADVFTFLFVILGFLIVYVAYWLATAGLFPRLTERCAERLGQSPVKSTLVGVAGWGALLLVGGGLSSGAGNGFLKGVGVVIMILSAIVALAGSSGVAHRIGSGLRSSRDESEPWRRVLRGGIVLGLTFVLPFVGQLIMVLTFAAGFGALVLSRPKRVKLVLSEPAPIGEPAAQ
ncbi:MAG: hypothetical protein ABMA13_06825 [Chthoniobacteraceae bacterium]